MIWLFTTLALAQSPAPEPTAEPTPADLDEAAALFDKGVRLYDEALYDQAITAFQRSYDLSGEHALLYNIANAQERLGDLEGTVETLNTYRIYAGEDEQDILDRRVRTLETRLLEEKKKEAERAEAAAAAAAAMVAANRPAEPTMPRMETRSNTAKWALLGAGAGTAAIFGTLSGITFAEGQRHRDAGDKGSYDSTRTLNNVSLAMTAVGVGLAGVGLALPSKREVPVIGLDIRRDRAHVALSWTY
jgi:tetratricopeptide (TPR) repeat protein